MVNTLRELDRDHLEQQDIVEAVMRANSEVLAYGRDHAEARGWVRQ